MDHRCFDCGRVVDIGEQWCKPCLGYVKPEVAMPAKKFADPKSGERWNPMAIDEHICCHGPVTGTSDPPIFHPSYRVRSRLARLFERLVRYLSK